MGEIVRLTKLHSGSWEEKAEGMKKVRADYQNMQRRLNIATKRIEMMSAEVCRYLLWAFVELYARGAHYHAWGKTH